MTSDKHDPYGKRGYSKGKRSRGAALVEIIQPDDDKAASMAQQAPDIPPHVWQMLQTAGEEAAAQLLELLRSPKFKTFRPSEQRSLIDLALTRAYGLPVKRSINVDLTSTDADAVAASLLGLHDQLPERRSPAPNSPDSAKSDHS